MKLILIVLSFLFVQSAFSLELNKSSINKYCKYKEAKEVEIFVSKVEIEAAMGLEFVISAFVDCITKKVSLEYSTYSISSVNQRQCNSLKSIGDQIECGNRKSEVMTVKLLPSQITIDQDTVKISLKNVPVGVVWDEELGKSANLGSEFFNLESIVLSLSNLANLYYDALDSEFSSKQAMAEISVDMTEVLKTAKKYDIGKNLDQEEFDVNSSYSVVSSIEPSYTSIISFAFAENLKEIQGYKELYAPSVEFTALDIMKFLSNYKD